MLCVCVCVSVDLLQVFAFALCLILGLERFWAEPAVESTVDGFNRVKYRPKPLHT